MNKPSRAGKVAHDLGLSTWFGGTLFGQLSLNPTVSSISDERERGRVLNEAWARFQAANLPAMLSSALLGWRSGALGTTRSCGSLPWRARKTCCSEDRPSTRLPLPSSGRPRQRSPGERRSGR